MSPPGKSHFWRRARVTFRWVRITGWLLLLALICLVLWLHHVGLPDFLKTRVLAALRSQGLEAYSDRIRLRWFRGIVVEEVRFRPSRSDSSPRLQARELVIRLDFNALLHRQVRLRGVSLQRASLSVPLVATNAPRRTVHIENLHAQVDFLSEDRWQLSTLQGECFGMEFHLSGTLTNAPALLARQRLPRPAGPSQAALWSEVISRIEQIQFDPPARVDGTFSGDGANAHASSARLELKAPNFRSPWARGENLAVRLTVVPQSNTLAQADLRLEARSLQTPWGKTRSILCRAHGEIPFANPNFQNVGLRVESEAPLTPWGDARMLAITVSGRSFAPPGWAEDSHVEADAQGLRTPWGSAASFSLKGGLRASPTNQAQAVGAWDLRCRQPQGAGLAAAQVQLELQTVHAASNLWPQSLQARLSSERPSFQSTNPAVVGRLTALAPAHTPPSPTARLLATQVSFDTTVSLPPFTGLELGQTNLPWPDRLRALPIDVQARIDGLQGTPLGLEKLTASCRWRWPEISVESARADFAGGWVEADGRLRTDGGRATATVSFNVDPPRLVSSLDTNLSPWNLVHEWKQVLRGEARLGSLLPAWTNWSAGWQQQAWSGLEASGSLAADEGTVRSIQLLSATLSFGFTNQHLRIHQLQVVRPEGSLQAGADLDTRTKAFQLTFRSGVDPLALRPLLGAETAGEGLADFQLTQPPALEGEVAGRWSDWAATSLRAHAALTNVTFRKQAMRSVVTDITYTNRLLDFLGPRILRDEGTARADRVRVDLRDEVLFLTNVQSTVEVAAVAAAIGPHIVKTLAPYQFAKPPAVHFEGAVGIHAASGRDDARFEVEGGPFQWKGFKLDQVNARMHWLGDTLTIAHLQGTLKGGQVSGDAWFDFSPAQGMDFRFRVTATNVSTRPLLVDVFPTSTNTSLDGLLGGHLVVTKANTASDTSWFGYGDATLRDGLIWDVPLFRYLSPLLNRLVPGIGNNRAREAKATFILTNSVFATRDLEIAASSMRMHLEGTLDFEGNIQGSIEAELFRDTPGVGWMLSRVLFPVTKVFVYKFSGVLGRPKLDPLYIPKILMLPFHPLRTLKELFSEEAPPGKPEPKTPPPEIHDNQ